MYTCKKLFQVFACMAVLCGSARAQTGMVTFTFDDASLSQYTNGFRIMDAYALPGTLFVITGGVDAGTTGSDPFFMTWEQVRQMEKNGWEIGAHTHSVPHPDLTTLSDRQLRGELAFSKHRIEQETQEAPQSFASPFGSFDSRVLKEVRRHFAAHFRAWGGTEGNNVLPVADVFDIGRFDVKPEYTSEFVCDKIAHAGTDGTWLVLMFHQVVEEAPEAYEVSAETFERIVACAYRLKHEGHIRVMTARDALQVMKGE